MINEYPAPNEVATIPVMYDDLNKLIQVMMDKLKLDPDGPALTRLATESLGEGRPGFWQDGGCDANMVDCLKDGSEQYSDTISETSGQWRSITEYLTYMFNKIIGLDPPDPRTPDQGVDVGGSINAIDNLNVNQAVGIAEQSGQEVIDLNISMGGSLVAFILFSLAGLWLVSAAFKGRGKNEPLSAADQKDRQSGGRYK